jgi:hypothetical protein
MLQIKRNNTLLLEVNPNLSDYVQKQRNGVDYAVVNFTQVGITPVDLALDDTVEILGTKYSLVSQLPIVEKESERKHNFSCVFEAEHYKLKRTKYFFLNSNNVLKEKSFSIMGDLSVFVGLIMLNLERDNPGKWKVGAVDLTETKLLSFDNENCLGAITSLVDQFQTEFWVNGNTLNFTSKAKDTTLVFKYGQGNGLYKITRGNQGDNIPITRLWVYGGTQNLPEGYRDYANTLQIAGPIELTSNPGHLPLNEDTVTFAEIFPRYIGVVTGTVNEFTFRAADLPYNYNNQLLPGKAGKVIFQTGLLAGYDIEIQSFDNTTKQFTIKTVTTETQLVIPGVDFHAEIGDTFIVVDIQMPSEFVTLAETELAAFGLEYFNANNFHKRNYSVAPDRLDFRRKAIKLNVGDSVRLVDAPLAVDRMIPIESFKTYYELDEYAYDMELSDYPIVDAYTRLIRQQIKQSQNGIPKPPIQSPKVFTYVRTASFKKECTGGLVGTDVNFSLKYVSNVSAADAESLANADTVNFNALGQANANDKGVCYVPKILNYIRVTNLTSGGDIAEFTVASDFPVKSNVLVTVNVHGSISGVNQSGQTTITANTSTGSGFTNSSTGSFTGADTLSGNVSLLAPTEDDTYRYDVA